jgi:hypothetical protein
MVENSNGNGRGVECTECEPPRRFKNEAGLNGHRQFKHGCLPDGRDVLPNGKLSQMYQDLTDRVNRVLDRQNVIFDHLKDGTNGNLIENGDPWPAARGTIIATNRLVFRIRLWLIRQLIPTKIAELNLQ